jgi:hypothetical protein
LDEIPLDPGDLLHLLEGVLLRPLHKGFPAVHVLIYKVLVKEILIDDHLEESHGQGRIGSGAELEP